MLGVRIGNYQPRVFIASGGKNFWGQGWPWHRLLHLLPGFNTKGACVIGKTTTLNPRAGNMPLNKNYQPREPIPECIIVKRKHDSVLNAVGLSGPGAEELFRHPGWKEIKPPFVYSFMSLATTPEERIEEAEGFASLIKALSKNEEYFFPKGDGIALEVNVSCPNTGHDTREFMGEVVDILKSVHDLRRTGIVRSIFLKVSVLMPVEIILDVQKSHLCDAIDCSNTIPYGALSDRIPWKEIFGSDTSPLTKFGGGGLSGKHLLPIVVDWIKLARDKGIIMPIIAGGGILCPEDVKVMKDVGADAVSIGSVLMLKPWNVKAIIEQATK